MMTRLLLACVFLLNCTPVFAQNELRPTWSALESARTLPDLHRVERPAAAGVRASVVDGLMRLRMYELGRDRTDGMVGRRTLERAVAQAPDDAWAHFALGALLARGPDVREVLGDDPAGYVVWEHSLAAAHAPRALKRALELDPTLHEASYVLAEFALDFGKLDLLRDALRSLSMGGRESLPRALLLQSRIHARIGALTLASRSAESARVAGADPAEAALVRAVALLRMSDSTRAGTAAYFDGVAALTRETAQMYFNDLRALLSDSDVAEWHAADTEGKKVWLRRFWDVSAGLAGVPVHERVAEHYVRLAKVFARGRIAPMGAGAAGDGSTDYRGFGVSDMGALLTLRHGDPLRARRVLLCKDVLDLPLPLQPHPAECAKTPYGRMMLIQEGESRLYTMQANAKAVTGASYYPPFDVHLALSWELLQMRGAAGRTDVIVAAAVPEAAVQSLIDDRANLRALLEMALVDTADGSVQRHAARVDQPLTGPVVGARLLTTTTPIQPRAGLQYRISLTNDGRSAGRIVGGDVDVRSYAGDVLQLSDVVLAPEDGSRAFSRGDVRLSLAPGREFRRGESATLYYEIYGLEEDAPYRTEIRIEREPDGFTARLRSLFPGARDVRILSFDDVAGVQHTVFGEQEERSVSLEGLAPGTYRVTIVVTDARTGAAARRDRVLPVVNP